MIDVGAARHIACVWYAAGEGFDFMGCLYQKHDASWEATYRFRYYAADNGKDPFESDDVKSWYTIKKSSDIMGCKEFERSVEGVFRTIFEENTGRKKLKLQKVEVRGGADKFMEALSKQSWIHMRVDWAAGKAKVTA